MPTPHGRKHSILQFQLKDGDLELSRELSGNVIIRGYAFNFKNVSQILVNHTGLDLNGTNYSGQDLSRIFTSSSYCKKYSSLTWDCASATRAATRNRKALQTCPSTSLLDGIPRRRVILSWSDIRSLVSSNKSQVSVFNNLVVNTSSTPPQSLPKPITTMLEKLNGNDMTHYAYTTQDTLNAALCLQERQLIGYLETASTGCLASNVIQTVSLIVILALVFTKFFMAIWFYWFVSGTLVKPNNMSRSHVVNVEPDYDSNPYTVMLVTCYSEGEESIKATLDSLTVSEYPDEKKLLFVVADGLVTGSGNPKSTPDIILGLVELDQSLPYPKPASYLAIADGIRQHNMGYVYSGHYVKAGHRVAIIVIVKCGTQDENTSQKPGNRGKRDSQLILMNFLSRCLFDDRMTRLDYEIRHRIHHHLSINPSQFAYVLMVDADTDVDRHAMKHMINAMLNDRNIMGLCGETRVRNKTANWVTAIQVFEYYASHHLGKAFESIFGGVTCLPGCFSMYRIKAFKEAHDSRYVPLLINPDIVEEYSENIVETLHKKNLLLLGEDRFLSTLMLRNFPRRKMMFVPQAVCHTVVPDEFKVLLSQRRRWINSTIHNLMELLLVRDLCGAFCFSMQFVVFIELVGTVVLPAAISFTIFLLLQTAATGQVQLIPMLLLVFILGLPGFMIVITTRQVEYIGWLGVYILSLPIWNFALPVYAFWHFDDFSWGQTRMVHGEVVKGGDKEGHHGGGGSGGSGKMEFDPSSVTLKTWNDWNTQSLMLRNNVRTSTWRVR
ncbi:chitin synthase [Obelidium mucronatum]|nr:chitin synthase [Obelidium mucronatum]